MSFPASSTAAPVEKRDYTVNRRLLMLSAIALGIGALSTVAASVLVNLIRFFTNLFFYQTLSLAETSPADHALGAWVIAVPVIGGLVVGLMARYGSDKIRGHGIPEAIEAVIERYGAEQHELAGRAKDMGSAAVFVLMLNVLLTWGLVLGPRLL